MEHNEYQISWPYCQAQPSPEVDLSLIFDITMVNMVKKINILMVNIST